MLELLKPASFLLLCSLGARALAPRYWNKLNGIGYLLYYTLPSAILTRGLNRVIFMGIQSSGVLTEKTYVHTGTRCPFLG